MKTFRHTLVWEILAYTQPAFIQRRHFYQVLCEREYDKRKGTVLGYVINKYASHSTITTLALLLLLLYKTLT